MKLRIDIEYEVDGELVLDSEKNDAIIGVLMNSINGLVINPGSDEWILFPKTLTVEVL